MGTSHDPSVGNAQIASLSMTLRTWSDSNTNGSQSKNRSPENYLISAVLRMHDHVTPASMGIEQEFFHAHDEEWEWIENYIRKHRKTPSKTAFIDKFPDFRISKVNDVEHFCNEVRKAHTRDYLNSQIERTLASLESDDLKDAIDHMHQTALVAGDRLQGKGEDADIFENWEDVYAEIEDRARRVEEDGLAGVNTGFPTIDYWTGGAQPGHLWYIAARLGQGKTSTLIRMATAACFAGKSVQFDSLEQSRGEISTRVHSYASSQYGRQTFKTMDLQRGKDFSLLDYKKFLKEMKNEDKGRFHIVDNKAGATSPLTVSAQIEKNSPDVVFIDYIQLMDIGNREGPQGFARLSSNMKRTAGQAHIPIIAAAQLNRKAEDSPDGGGTETLAESDAFGRDADVVLIMHQINSQIVKFKLAKNRHGKDGIVFYAHFDPNNGVLEEVTWDKAKDIMASANDDDEEENLDARYDQAMKNSKTLKADIKKNKSKTLRKPA